MSTVIADVIGILTNFLCFIQAKQVNFIQISYLKTEKIYAIL